MGETTIKKYVFRVKFNEKDKDQNTIEKQLIVVAVDMQEAYKKVREKIDNDSVIFSLDLLFKVDIE